jgi:hypothetical protein
MSANLSADQIVNHVTTEPKLVKKLQNFSEFCEYFTSIGQYKSVKMKKALERIAAFANADYRRAHDLEPKTLPESTRVAAAATLERVVRDLAKETKRYGDVKSVPIKAIAKAATASAKR